MLPSAELQISRLCSAKDGLRVPADLCCRELGPRMGRQGASSAALQRTTDVSATTEHV